MQEIWKDIKGYERLYQVSNLGKIKSLNYNHTKEEKIRKLDKSNKGYLSILLCNNNGKKKYNVHRLVAEAFIPNPDNLPQVNHIDGNKENNQVNNLEWCTNGYNEAHAYKLGLKSKNYGSKNGMAKAVLQFDLDNNFIDEYKTIEEAHQKTKIAVDTIIRSCKNRTKKHNKYIFKYKEE